MRKHTALTRTVKHAYRKHMLAQICTLPEEKFGRAFGMQTIDTGHKGPGGYYHYRDNGSRVLAVAHLDTVVRRHRRTPRFDNTLKGPRITSGALDDRLGAYVILGLLPRLGINCDVLLTVGEESGESTAQDFCPGKEYDWAIEFDRMGTDVVMYQYEDAASARLVEASGAPVGWGSFSDIAYLEHLGVKAFNWGVGYRGNYHSESGYAYLNDTFAMVAKYVTFHQQNAGTVMAHIPDAREDYRKTPAWYDGEDCYMCAGKRTVDYATMICDACGYCADCCERKYDCQCYTPASGSRLDIPAQTESLDDALAGARAAYESTSAGWASGELAIGKAASLGNLGYTEAERRITAMRDAQEAFAGGESQ